MQIRGRGVERVIDGDGQARKGGIVDIGKSVGNDANTASGNNLFGVV